MRRNVKWAAAFFLLIGGASARADMTFMLSGSFGDNNPSGPTGLEYGSFSGTYTVSGFDTTGATAPLTGFDLTLFDSSGNVFTSYNFSDPHEGATLKDDGSIATLFFGTDGSDPNEANAGFQLLFAGGFEGVGPVLYTDSTVRLSSHILVTFASGVTHVTQVHAGGSSAVPEPSSLVLMGIAGLGLAWRRRKKGRAA